MSSLSAQQNTSLSQRARTPIPTTTIADRAVTRAVQEPLPEAAPLAPLGQVEPARTPEQPPLAAARFQGLAAPGLQIVLNADGSTGKDLRYRWIQTQGPLVELADPRQASVRLTVPDNASLLEFLLVVSNEAGMDSIPLKIAIEGAARSATDGRLKADAGDDQIAVVGRQITLNGMRSEPRAKVGYRWIQTGGPPVKLKIEQGPIFSFVPSTPETYKFALVVAAGDMISEPDEVIVTSQLPATSNASVAPVASSLPSAFSSEPRPLRPIESPLPPPPSRAVEGVSQSVQSALQALQAGPTGGLAVAEAFDMTIDRMTLYSSYRDMHAEMARRLDAVVPRDEAARRQWVERLFAPVTARMIDEMRREGLDMTTAAGWDTALTSAQKTRLIEVFRAVGDGARAVARADGGGNQATR